METICNHCNGIGIIYTLDVYSGVGTRAKKAHRKCNKCYGTGFHKAGNPNMDKSKQKKRKKKGKTFGKNK